MTRRERITAKIEKRRAWAETRKTAARAAEAEAAGGVTIKTGANYATVTFAEKPDYAIIAALKAAGFHWGQGAWHGMADKVPEAVKALLVGE